MRRLVSFVDLKGDVGLSAQCVSDQLLFIPLLLLVMLEGEKSRSDGMDCTHIGQTMRKRQADDTGTNDDYGLLRSLLRQVAVVLGDGHDRWLVRSLLGIYLVLDSAFSAGAAGSITKRDAMHTGGTGWPSKGGRPLGPLPGAKLWTLCWFAALLPLLAVGHATLPCRAHHSTRK